MTHRVLVLLSLLALLAIPVARGSRPRTTSETAYSLTYNVEDLEQAWTEDLEEHLRQSARPPRPVRQEPAAQPAAQNNLDQLSNLITGLVEPKTWRSAGGQGTLRRVPGKPQFVVVQVQEVHESIADLLEQMRRYAEPFAARRRIAEDARRRQWYLSEPLRRADEFPGTEMLPHTRGKLVPGRNYLYCVTTQLAWKNLQDRVGGTVQLQGTPPLADALNAPLRPTALSPSSYVALAGTIEGGILNEVRREMTRKFPGRVRDYATPADPRSVVAYAYLFKMLNFVEKFDRLRQPLRFGRGAVRVRGFGLPAHAEGPVNDRIRAQVTVLDYVSDDDFVLRLQTTSPDDDLVLAKVAPQATLAATLDQVEQRIRERAGNVDSQGLHLLDELAVPMLHVNIAEDYTTSLNGSLTNPGWEGRRFAWFAQGIRFHLDERGVVLESEELEALMASPPKPRHFVFDKPFLVRLKQTAGKAPYFALWVGNAELMEPVNRK